MIDKAFSEWRKKAIENSDKRVTDNFDKLLNTKWKSQHTHNFLIGFIIFVMAFTVLFSSIVIYKSIQELPNTNLEVTSYPNYQETTNNYQIGNYNTTNNNINYPIIPSKRPIFYVLSVYLDGKWKEVMKSTDKEKVENEYERLKRTEKYLNLRMIK